MEVYVLPNSVKHIYGEEYAKEKKIALVGAKGERVAFQAIVQGSCHNVRVHVQSGLKTEMFFEKYVPVKKTGGRLMKPGLYPDPLLDVERAYAFAENNADEGELLLWCFAEIPERTEKTEYEVVLFLSADEGEGTVRAGVSVMDFCLPASNHNVTSFLVRCDMISAKDETELIRKYDELIELGLQYKCSPTRIVPWAVKSHEVILEKMLRWTKDIRCTSYAIPYRTVREPDPVTGKSDECIDLEDLYALYLEMAERSTDACNLFAKANMYVGFIDEPVPENFYRVRRVYREIHDLKRKIVREYDFTDKRGVESALLTMDNIVTVFNKEPIYGEVDTWCPTYWAYSKPEYVYEEEKLRGLGKKNWWYGCTSPWTPFPNLHTDAPMKDHRFESWLRYKFDIKGMVYWATNLTKRYTEGKYVPCDLFEEQMIFPGANGDGMLFYTDTKYGAPLPSLRLASLYLGMQEYEYFYLLDEAAKLAVRRYGKAFDVRGMLKPLFDRLGTGTLLAYEPDEEFLRRQLGARVLLAQKGVFVESEIYADRCVLRGYAPAGRAVRVNGKKGKKSVCGAGVCWSFEIPGADKTEVEITACGVSERLLIAEKRVELPAEKAERRSGKLTLSVVADKMFIHSDVFVNEEAPSVFLPLKGDFGNIRAVEADVENLVGDAFIANAVLVDEDGHRYHAGYGVAKEHEKNHICVGVTKITQNRLNNVEDVSPSMMAERNLQAVENFRFDRLAGVELLFENNIKLLDENRERRASAYDFLIGNGYVSVL